MTGTTNVNDIEVLGFDYTIEMNVDKIQARRGSPVAQQPRLDVIQCQRLFQKRVVK